MQITYMTETVIFHNFPNEATAGDCDPARCARHSVVYDLTMPQITALIEQSAECHQFIKVKRFLKKIFLVPVYRIF